MQKAICLVGLQFPTEPYKALLWEGKSEKSVKKAVVELYGKQVVKKVRFLWFRNSYGAH